MTDQRDWSDLTRGEPVGWWARFKHRRRVRKEGPRPFWPWSVEWDDTGIVLLQYRLHHSSIKWSEINCIVAHQWIAITFDLVCLSFYADKGENELVCADEFAPGFDDLVAEIERRYPVTPPDWRYQVDKVVGAGTVMCIWQSENAPVWLK